MVILIIDYLNPLIKDIMNQNLLIKLTNDCNISEFYSLEELGIDNIAFPYKQALMLVDILRESHVSILGGDVYLKKGSCIEISYDNWYCEKGDGELDCYFIKRSCDIAESYIKNYIRNTINKPLFSFVLRENDCSGF